MNDKLKVQLQILKLSEIKPNFSKLARQYGMDRRTIKKYYDGYEGKPVHRQKPSRLDVHQELITQKLNIQGTNVKAVYEYIKTSVDPDIGSYSNFNKYIKSNKLLPKHNSVGHPRFETAPGVQAQVDWKEDVSIRNRNGETFTIQVFAYKLGNSRYTHFTYKLYKTRQDVFDCLIASFKATGGVPREILFDNMSSVVDRDGKRINISNKVRAFAHDFNFKIKLCKPRHPYTKGKVEVANKFIAWLLPYEGEFDTEDELKELLCMINKKINSYPCQETGVPPLLLLQKEKEYLQPLPKNEIIESYLSQDRQTTVRSDAMITYMNSKYSVPIEYIGKPVRLLVNNNTLYIYYSTELIAEHMLSKKKLNYNEDHYKDLLSLKMTDADAVTKFAESNLRLMDDFL